MRLRETGYTETSILGILGDCHGGPSGSPRAPVSVLRGSPLLRTAGLMHRQTADVVSVVSGESRLLFSCLMVDLVGASVLCLAFLRTLAFSLEYPSHTHLVQDGDPWSLSQLSLQQGIRVDGTWLHVGDVAREQVGQADTRGTIACRDEGAGVRGDSAWLATPSFHETFTKPLLCVRRHV